MEENKEALQDSTDNMEDINSASEQNSTESKESGDIRTTVIKCVSIICCLVIVMVSLNNCITKYSDTNRSIAEVMATKNNTPADGFVDGSDDYSANLPSDGTVPPDADTQDPADSDGAAPTDAPSQNPASPAATTPSTGGSSATANKKPTSKQEIVTYFNKAINGVKPGAKSIKHHYSKISLNGGTTLPGWADSVLKILGGADKFINDQLSKNSTGEQTYTGADIKANFPVEGESWSSKLTAADVQNATCTSANGKYTIKISTVADAKSSTVTRTSGHAPKAFNVVLPSVVNDNVPGVAKSMVGTAEMNYPSSTITAVVDVATGRVLTADYRLCWTINFGTNIIIPFVTSDSYTINW